uniref:VWFD domain-containing protein n=1 Tax=Ornithorhynchus anatinus TaxID=9258 RepID=A0A6I8NXF0_ORNAN
SRSRGVPEARLPAFRLWAKSEAGGGWQMSICFVTLNMFGYTVTAAKNEHGFVRVNSQRLRLPASLGRGRLRLCVRGRRLWAEASGGLQLLYDWSHHLELRLPRRYAGRVGGLCGNFNGDPSDDLMTPDGQLARDARRFATGWTVEPPRAACHRAPWGAALPRPCPPDLERERGAACGVLEAAEGPFAACHAVVAPRPYLYGCRADLCTSQGYRPVLCQALETYAHACQREGARVGDWRGPAGCPLSCPEHSHYEACGSACPASCNPQVPAAPCPLPCLETCACDPGYVRSGAGCVARARCGCVRRGRLFAPGEAFWSGDGCRRRCRCHGPSGRVRCRARGCRAGEECRVAAGLRGCQPTRFGTCTAAGTAHYVTFDGRRYDFPGTCTYLLPRRRRRLAPYRVLVRPGPEPGRTRRVDVELPGCHVRLDHPPCPQVNGVLRNLPWRLGQDRVLLYRQGWDVVVRCSFGLTVTFDGHSRLAVTLPACYAGAVAGLCANFNGDPADDLLMPGPPTLGLGPGPDPDALAFGRSYRVQSPPGCGEPGPSPCPHFPLLVQRLRASGSGCGLLLSPDGPFRLCHGRVDPEGYFRDCVLDACARRGQPAAACPVVSCYASACQEAGATVYPWRTARFCPPCPPHSHYEVCAGCPVTCHSLFAPQPCRAPCREGCTCDAGYVLSGAACVPLGQCGCVHRGVYYQPGERFSPDGRCRERCLCGPGGAVSCRPTPCAPPRACRLIGGAPRCSSPRPARTARCLLAGGPHYRTFDGAAFDFHGTCSYTLAQTGPRCPRDLPRFGVTVENAPGGAGRGALTRRVLLRVDGLRRCLPFSLPQGRVRVFLHGANVVLLAAGSLVLLYDQEYHLSLALPAGYAGHTRGLCGNFQRGPDGRPGPAGRRARPFGEAERAPFRAPASCGLLLAPSGPFGGCHAAVPPRSFFDNCVADMCRARGDPAVLLVGPRVGPWRSPAFSMRCPSNSHYRLCAHPCPATCSAALSIVQRPDTCAEGCQCDSGYFPAGTACVPAGHCSCFRQGRFYRPGQAFWTPGCGQRCLCSPETGEAECQEDTCPGQCQLSGALYRCLPLPPARPTSPAPLPALAPAPGHVTCTASGDFHYTTFGGAHYDFSGTCDYQLAGICEAVPGLQPFRVTVRNRVLPVACAQDPGGSRPVNGVAVTLPYYHGSRLRAYASGFHLRVDTDFGLSLIFDWSSLVLLSLPPAYGLRSCGLCGARPGTPPADLPLLASAWLVGRPPGCGPTCGTRCPRCPEGERTLYQGPGLCGLLTAPLGPLAPCHATVDPAPHFADCLVDVCQHRGCRRALCQALATYVVACQARGVALRTWRRPDFCRESHRCPPHSHYELCSDGCPVTCHGLAPPPGCVSPCREGCACDPGYVLSGAACVPAAQCGCVHGGRYHPRGEAWYEACLLAGGRPRCGPGGGCVAACAAWCPAAPSPHLTGSGPRSPSWCWAQGALYYRTFDGKTFQFRGNCSYVMVESDGRGSPTPPFLLETSTDRLGDSRAYSFSRSFTLRLYGHKLSASRYEPGLLDGQLSGLPVSLPDAQLTVTQHGRSLLLVTNFALRLIFDWDAWLGVRLPSNIYRGRVSGLCGNLDGNSSNDQVTPAGVPAPKTEDFAGSWRVPGLPSEDQCYENCSCPECPQAQEREYRARELCGALNHPSGPFAACHGLVSPAGFRQNCIRDLCAAGRHQPTLCRAFTAYALACQEAGIALGTWREQTRCRECGLSSAPPDSDYEPCGDPCVPTCADPYPGSCAGRCVERCRCRPGLLLNRGRCVPPAQCGCQHKGQALPPGAQFWEDAACSRRCRCHPDTRTVECEPGACQPGQACGVRGGLRGCYPIRWATCSSPGDPHYISFDGRAFAFHNPCGTYLLAGVEGSGLPLEDFQILLDSNRTSGDASSRTVRVRLNGSPTHLPYLPNDLPLTVHRVGFLAELRTGFDLIVTFDWSNQVRVSVPVAYEGALRGLCGDLDGNPGNDLIPRGEPRDPASKPDDPVAFAGSWREPGPDGQTCAEPVVRPAACPNPEAAERAQRQSPVACGLLVDPKGPFRDCHAMHDPDPAFRRCTYLSCSEPRDPDRVCQELAHYTSVCQLAGRRVDPWRSGSFCGMLCPVHSHYDVCGSGCEDTCGSPWAPTPCARQCREGCVCDSGHLLSGDQCVEPKQCGCLHDGVYYEAGSEFYPGPQCTPRCRCGAGGMVVCEPSSCRRGERCVVQGGVPECRPHGSISCFVRGRGHLVTFDGRAVDIPEHRAYVLAQAPGPQPFTVRLGHGRRGQREGPATRWVELEMAGSVLVLEEKRSGVIEAGRGRGAAGDRGPEGRGAPLGMGWGEGLGARLRGDRIRGRGEGWRRPTALEAGGWAGARTFLVPSPLPAPRPLPPPPPSIAPFPSLPSL